MDGRIKSINGRPLCDTEVREDVDRIKRLEECEVSEVVTESDFYSVEDTNNGYLEGIKLEGKTLVNLSDMDASYGTNLETSDRVKVRFINKDRCSNGTYTLINFTDKTIKFNLWEVSTHSFSKRITVDAFSSVKAEIESNLSIYGVEYWISDGWSNADLSIYKPSMYAIIEGDHTDKPISSFEGLKSVGQDVNEISVLSVNENLFDEQIRNGKYNTITGAFSVSDEIKANVNAIRVEPNTQYFINRTGIGNDILNRIFYYDYSMNLISSETKGNTTFTTPNNCYYINFHIATHEVTSQNKIQISKGNQITNYTPHKQDKKRILYYNTDTRKWEKPVLREWDSIEKHSDGKYYYHVRSCEVTLNGSENWVRRSMANENSTMGFGLPRNYIDESSDTSFTPCVCDKFMPHVTINTSGWNTDSEIIYINDYVHIRINKSRLSSEDVAGFKSWLQANNVTVVYQLAEEQVYECTNLDLISYQDETNYIVNSGAITPKSSFNVHSDISNVVTLLQKNVNEGNMHEHTGYQQYALTDNLGYVINAGSFLDANVLTTPGFFRANIESNIPNPGTYYVEVYKYSDTYLMQRLTHINGTFDGIYFRIMKAGVWDPWQKITATSTDSASSYSLRETDTVSEELMADVRNLIFEYEERIVELEDKVSNMEQQMVMLMAEIESLKNNR